MVHALSSGHGHDLGLTRQSSYYSPGRLSGGLSSSFLKVVELHLPAPTWRDAQRSAMPPLRPLPLTVAKLECTHELAAN